MSLVAWGLKLLETCLAWLDLGCRAPVLPCTVCTVQLQHHCCWSGQDMAVALPPALQCWSCCGGFPVSSGESLGALSAAGAGSSLVHAPSEAHCCSTGIHLDTSTCFLHSLLPSPELLSQWAPGLRATWFTWHPAEEGRSLSLSECCSLCCLQAVAGLSSLFWLSRSHCDSRH